MKKSSIIQENKEIKEYIEKNKRIPKTCTINEKIYSIYSTSYLSALLIKNNFKDIDYQLPTVILYDNTPPKDTIDEKVMKEDYLKMVSNFVNYCKETRRVPAYITTQKSKTKVSFDLFVYCLSKIIVFYQENKYLPNYCYFVKGYTSNNASNNSSQKNNSNSSTSSCQNKVNLNKGCEAMGQNNSWYCGVSALQKCLYKFGINESQKQLAKACGTTTAGTSHQGLRTGIAWVSKKHNVKLNVNEAYFSDYTMKQMHDILCNPKKAIICHSLYRNKYGHYEAWKNVNVDKKEFEVINSLGDKCALGCYCGYVEHRSYATQKQYCNGISQKSLIIITKT